MHENTPIHVRTHVRKIFPIRNFGKFENTFPVHTYLIDARTKNKVRRRSHIKSWEQVIGIFLSFLFFSLQRGAGEQFSFLSFHFFWLPKVLKVPVFEFFFVSLHGKLQISFLRNKQHKEQDMIQTQLLRLDPPYQIIACRGEVGMQIATLIVTEETRKEDNKYGITTHSHPVVAYLDKLQVKKMLETPPDDDDYEEDPSLNLCGEGVVWDKVEVSETSMVCMSDQTERKLTSFGFCRLATEMLEDIALSGKWQGHRLMELGSNLMDFGVTILKEEEKHPEVVLSLSEGEFINYGDKEVIDNENMLFPMPVPVMESEKMLKWFRRIIRQYNLILGEDIRFKFRSRYEPPYEEDYLEDDFDPNHLTPAQKACNEVVELLRNTDLYRGLSDE